MSVAMERKIKWWGYLHTNGSIHTKRYFDRLDIVEAKGSPFVKEIHGPFECSGADKAREEVYNHFHFQSLQIREDKSL